jgi:hypothetical protein
MNFNDVWTRQQAEDLVPPCLVTQEEHSCHRELERRFIIAERDEHPQLEWATRFPEDIAAEKAHFAKREAAQNAAKKDNRLFRRADKAARRTFIEASLEGPQTIFDNDDRWADQFSSTPVLSTILDLYHFYLE